MRKKESKKKGKKQSHQWIVSYAQETARGLKVYLMQSCGRLSQIKIFKNKVEKRTKDSEMTNNQAKGKESLT
jgi:hypothetical protein